MTKAWIDHCPPLPYRQAAPSLLALLHHHDGATVLQQYADTLTAAVSRGVRLTPADSDMHVNGRLG